MKQGIKIFLSLVFIFTLAFIVNIFIDSPIVSAVAPTNTPTPVLPKNTPTVIPPTLTPTRVPPTATMTATPLATAVATKAPRDETPANKTWIVSSEESSAEVPMYMVPLPAPHAWEILLSNAIELNLSAPVQICHPFRGNQFGWTGAIYLRSGSGWVEIPSTTAWTPDEEGSILICATAPMSGTYAIFGYNNGYEPMVVEDEEPPRNDLPVGFVFALTEYVME